MAMGSKCKTAGGNLSCAGTPRTSIPAPAHERPRTRAERKAERQSRIAARAARIAKRLARAGKSSARKSKPVTDALSRGLFASNDDPLLVFDRQENPVDLRGLWAGAAGFLVCGGPSVNRIDGLSEMLQSRGVVSLAVNNVAGHLPVRAMTFSDPPEKFHHGIFFDPAMMKFVPRPKLSRGQVRIKYPDGTFKFSGLLVRDCPNVWGYERSCEFRAGEFLTATSASWGNNNDGVRATGGPKVLFTMLLGVRLMHYLGCRRVFLLGADFRMTEKEGGGYSFSQGRTGGAAMSNNGSYRIVNGFFKELRPVLEAAGMTVENCNPASALEAFTYTPVDEAFRIARGFVPPGRLELGGMYEFKGEGRGESEG